MNDERVTFKELIRMTNLLLASQKARKGKSLRNDVEDFWMRRETNLMQLQRDLRNQTYAPGPYRMFEIFEPKRRLIAAAPFRDRVVHHALCNIIQPILQRRFIPRSFSCQLAKGTTAARECCRKLVNQHRYVLKCDVRKFFPTIDHEILLKKLAEMIRCPELLGLCRQIISGYQTGPDIAPNWFLDEDLFQVNRKIGLPIGNLTSQLWGNLYLDEMDHRITDGLGVGAFIRYTDDFLIFSDSKPHLWEIRQVVEKELAKLRLIFAEPKSRLLTTREGVPFCGFLFFPGLRPRILGATKRRFEQRRDAETDMRKQGVTVFAWYQFSREGNSEGLRRAYSQKRWTQPATSTL